MKSSPPRVAPSKRGRPEKWEVPEVVPRSQVRPHIAAIARYAAAGAEVLVGRSAKAAYSAFVSLTELSKRRSSFEVDPRPVDIETLRRKWSSERERVENTGRPIVILRNNEPLAGFVPTPHAMETKVVRARQDRDERHVQSLGDLMMRIAALEGKVGSLESKVNALAERIPGETEWRQAMALGGQLHKEWRARQGHPPVPTTK